MIANLLISVHKKPFRVRVVPVVNRLTVSLSRRKPALRGAIGLEGGGLHPSEGPRNTYAQKPVAGAHANVADEASLRVGQTNNLSTVYAMTDSTAAQALPEQGGVVDGPDSSDELYEGVYAKLVESVCIKVAAKMHRMAKSGELSYADLVAPKKRRLLYPGLYNSEVEVVAALDRYAVETPVSQLKTLRRVTNEPASSSPAPMVIEDRTESSVSISTRQQVQTDIWGRIPAKEPKELVACSICKRQVNGTRFAQHLDKCLGIGTMARAAASGSGSVRSGLK